MERLLGVAGRAIIRRCDGRILLIRREEGASTDAGRWELPGGKMDYGESLTDALAREVSEETGLVVNPGDVVHVGHQLVEPFWVTVVTFECGESDGEVTLSSEHSDSVWATVDEIERLPMSDEARQQVRRALVSGAG